MSVLSSLAGYIASYVTIFRSLLLLFLEHFGSEVVLSGDEAKDEEDEEYDKDPDPLPDLSPK